MDGDVQGTPFGHYRLIELLGRGGMGEVWRAYDPTNDRDVALKVLPAHFANDRVFQERFRREARAAARLNSPHVIPIHNSGEIEGRLFVDMRLVEGRDLQTVLADGPLDSDRAIRIIEQVARALHAAHKVGLVHRDVKPSNILLDDNDFVYLIDFGIAHAAGETRLTDTGGFVGSWQYMAPERFSAQQADTRADVYALACVFYECLTGHTPYPGGPEQQYAGHVHTPPPRPSNTDPNLSWFDPITEKGLAKDPAQRYRSPVDLADAARSVTTDPIARRPPTARRDAPPTVAETVQAQPDPDLSGPRRSATRMSYAIVSLEIVLGMISLLYLVLITGFVVRDTLHPLRHHLGAAVGAGVYPLVAAWWLAMLALLVDVVRRVRLMRGKSDTQSSWWRRKAVVISAVVWLAALAVVVVGSVAIAHQVDTR